MALKGKALLIMPLREFFDFSSEEVDLEKDFEQNELNSAVYLISVAMQISNFAVNYKVSNICLTSSQSPSL